MQFGESSVGIRIFNETATNTNMTSLSIDHITIYTPAAVHHSCQYCTLHTACQPHDSYWKVDVYESPGLDIFQSPS